MLTTSDHTPTWTASVTLPSRDLALPDKPSKRETKVDLLCNLPPEILPVTTYDEIREAFSDPAISAFIFRSREPEVQAAIDKLQAAVLSEKRTIELNYCRLSVDMIGLFLDGHSNNLEFVRDYPHEWEIIRDSLIEGTEFICSGGRCWDPHVRCNPWDSNLGSRLHFDKGAISYIDVLFGPSLYGAVNSDSSKRALTGNVTLKAGASRFKLPPGCRMILKGEVHPEYKIGGENPISFNRGNGFLHQTMRPANPQSMSAWLKRLSFAAIAAEPPDFAGKHP
ncbi:MAG: hypothetical protein KDD53_10650 [Bdellovibrionales bacterium]|nr:hypothetical protein [Bdellovibrionales bacterium]